jgi:hypothetical protein
MLPKTDMALLRNRFIGCSATYGPIYTDLLMPMPQARLLSVLEQVLIQKLIDRGFTTRAKQGTIIPNPGMILPARNTLKVI